MKLSSNFAFDFSSSIFSPMIKELDKCYSILQLNLKDAKKYYNELKQNVINILKNNPPTVEDVELLNADLGGLLVALNDGGVNFDNLGNATYGMIQSGFEFDPNTGKLKTMPMDTVNQLIDWVKNSILFQTNQQYLDSVLSLKNLMICIDKVNLEKIFVLLDSIIAANIQPKYSSIDIQNELELVGLSLNDDPDISKLDNDISELFVQKHLVTTKIYTEIEKQLIFLGGYDPNIINNINKTNIPSHYNVI